MACYDCHDMIILCVICYDRIPTIGTLTILAGHFCDHKNVRGHLFACIKPYRAYKHFSHFFSTNIILEGTTKNEPIKL